MINKIGTEIPAQVRFNGQENQTQQSSLPPVHKYVERNQLFNIAASGVLGTMLGVVNSRDELTRTIEAAGGEGRATIKEALSSGNLVHTLGKVGKTILLLSGALYISDYAFQKVLKTNKDYEDYYNENRN